jgi:hypothetical protein
MKFVSTCCATTTAWPHQAAVVDFHATEGRSWRLSLSADGARITRLPTLGTMPVTAAPPSSRLSTTAPASAQRRSGPTLREAGRHLNRHPTSAAARTVMPRLTDALGH